MLIDIEELEKKTMQELEEYKDWIIEIPKTQEEFDRRFSLKNDEVNIDDVEFEDIELSELSGLIVEPPKTKEEFNRRFSLWTLK